MLRRALAQLLGPLMRGLARHLDPWDSAEHPLPDRITTSTLPYLQAASGVRVATVDELCDWLAGADYLPGIDPDHPLARNPALFERERRGNCRARALWAWRKLSELGFDPEFMVGVWSPSPPLAGPHAWVRFIRDGKDYLLEATARSAPTMVRRLDNVRAEYVPHFSVLASGTTRVYREYVSAMWS